MAFHVENYRRLRAYLLTREGKFNWLNPFQDDEYDGCVACACQFLSTGKNSRNGANNLEISAFIGCSKVESKYLYWPNQYAIGEYPDWNNVQAAIAKLDAVAARYGVTPEPPPVQDEAAVGLTVGVSGPAIQPVAPRSDSEREAAYLAELRAFVAAPALSPEEAR